MNRRIGVIIIPTVSLTNIHLDNTGFSLWWGLDWSAPPRCSNKAVFRLWCLPTVCVNGNLQRGFLEKFTFPPDPHWYYCKDIKNIEQLCSTSNNPIWLLNISLESCCFLEYSTCFRFSQTDVVSFEGLSPSIKWALLPHFSSASLLALTWSLSPMTHSLYQQEQDTTADTRRNLGVIVTAAAIYPCGLAAL